MSSIPDRGGRHIAHLLTHLFDHFANPPKTALFVTMLKWIERVEVAPDSSCKGSSLRTPKVVVGGPSLVLFFVFAFLSTRTNRHLLIHNHIRRRYKKDHVY
jgi:hypothetical protein